MRERTECGSDNEQNENDNGDEISEDYSWPTATSQRSVRNPDCKQRVHGGEGIAKSWILVLYESSRLVSLNSMSGMECKKHTI
jgi:hypothetical protein